VITDPTVIKEAISTFIAMAAEKLRAQGSCAARLSLFLHNRERIGSCITQSLPLPTAYTPDLITLALHLFETLYTPGEGYRKAGIMLQELVSEKNLQLDFFEKPKNQKLMKLIDRINKVHGDGTLFFGAEGTNNGWAQIRKNVSPRFTTCWDDLLTIDLT
jgi:DNA polymerase V